MTRTLNDVIDELDIAVFKYCQMKNPKEGAYPYEAGFRSALMRSMAQVPPTKGAMKAFLEKELSWIESELALAVYIHLIA